MYNDAQILWGVRWGCLLTKSMGVALMNNILNSDFFFSTAIVSGVAVATGLLLLYILVNINQYEEKTKSMALFNKATQWVEFLEEFVLSIFVILAGACLYCYLDSTIIETLDFQQYSSVIQIVIIISIIAMNLISRNFEHSLSSSEKSSIRLLGSFYSVLNLIIIRIITNDNSIDVAIISYGSLLLGRFIFFDSSVSAICKDLKNIGVKIFLFPALIIVTVLIILFNKNNEVNLVDDEMAFQFVIIYFSMLFGLKAAKNIIKGIQS